VQVALKMRMISFLVGGFLIGYGAVVAGFVEKGISPV
jgi:hypothetical protein